MERVFYSSSVHDEREIEAVVEVLRSGPQGLWPGRVSRHGAADGRSVRQAARRDGQLRLVGAVPGGRAAGPRSGGRGHHVRADVLDRHLTDRSSGPVPVFVDVEPDTFCVDAARIEETITPHTGAMLFPNLIGNTPDWDAIRAIADRRGLPVIEDSCDTIGPRLLARRRVSVRP